MEPPVSLPKLTLAARADYLSNAKNGGGTFNVGGQDGINGFGAGDPGAAGYDINKGANRYALSVAGTYRLTPNVAFRGELRHDHASTAAFFYYGDQSYRKTNDVLGLQTVVNF